MKLLAKHVRVCRGEMVICAGGGGLLLAWVVAMANFGSTDAADDPRSATRTQLERIQSLRKERPGDGALVFYEAITRIELGEREAAFALLRSLQGRKLGLVPVRDAGFEAVWDNPEFQKIREKLAQEESRTPDAPVAFRLGDSKLIPEGIADDPKQDRFFIGSVARKKIVSANQKGEVKDFSGPGDNLDCVLGLFVDAAHEQLYAVSTNGFLDEAQKQRRNAVVRYDLRNGLLVNRYDAPDASQLNDLTIAADGTIYATDSASGTLFRKTPGEKTLTPFGAKGALSGANGITLGADGKLYVAISTGIAKIDLDRSAHAPVATRHSCNRRLRWALLAHGRLGWNSERDKSRARHSHCARRSGNTDFRNYGVAIASSS